MTWERRLKDLLDQDPSRLEREAAARWAALTRGGQAPFVLFGAGGLGRSTLAGLAAEGAQILAFVDNAPAKWGTVLDGVPVLSPEEAVRQHGAEACFVVTIWRAEGGHRYQTTRDRLRELGAGRVAHFGDLARACPDRFLPYYALDRLSKVHAVADQILDALGGLADGSSREVFCRHAVWRITLDFDCIPEADSREIYFPAGTIDPQAGEVLVDGGAFDGDSAARFLELWGPKAGAVHAFEPDPGNAARLLQRFQTTPALAPVHLHSYALGAEAGELSFQAAGVASSRVSGSGTVRVACRPLDEALGNERVGLIKLDVEGAEPSILRGAKRLLNQQRPRLAICLYHTQAHLWELPLLLRQLVPGYRFTLINHGTEAWDLVLYGLPD